MIRSSLVEALLMVVSIVFAHGGNEQIGSGDSSKPTFNPDLNFAQVEHVRATEVSDGVWRFDVTVRHNDEGWDHYADAWRVVDPRTGEILGERILAHPHETEQPFTRSLSGVSIPDSVSRVLVQAKCNVHGFGGREIVVDLSKSGGDGFQVQRRR
ncbi:MAG: hypothetical protein JSV89_09290 [Spirochaetaceae bacterium]|nr:MAG: hypothetical protein JSV89_09290 [Spirochaetaceae bacterium]